MVSSVCTATTLLFCSAYLVFAGPQYAPLQIGGLTEGSAFNLDPNPHAAIFPPSNFISSSSKDGPPDFEGTPNLAFLDRTTAETTPETYSPADSTGFTTDNSKTITLSDDDPFNIASPTQPMSKLRSILTEDVLRYMDSLFNGYSTYGIFGVSSDLSKLVTLLTSTRADWKWFARDVRDSEPSFALHPTPDGILFIFTYQNVGPDSFSQNQARILDNTADDFWLYVGNRYKKKVFAYLVFDDYTLRTAINTHNHAEAVGYDE